MRRLRLGPWLLVLACLAGPGCGKRAPPSVEEAAPLSVTFELAGCAAVIAGSAGLACEVTETDRAVRIRVEREDVPVRVSWGSVVLAPRVTSLDGGQLVTVEVPSGGEAGALVVIAGTAPASATFRIEVRRADRNPGLDRASALRREGRVPEAIASMPEPSSLPEPLRGRAVSLRARLDLASGRAEDAIVGLRAGMRLHRRDGRISDVVADAMALVHTLIEHGRRYGEARAVLAEVAAPLAAWGEGRARAAYYRASLAQESGDLRGALRDLGEAERAARRVESAQFVRSARARRAQILQALGRSGEARAILAEEARQAPDPGGDPCLRAELLTGIGWIELSAREAPSLEEDAPAHASDLERTLAGALAEHEQHCPRPSFVQNAHVNLALAAAQKGDAKGAALHVKAARALGPPPTWITAWLLDVEARVALLEDRPADALARCDELAARARAAYAPEVLWRALAGRSRALERLARVGDAIAALREAEQLLDRWAPAIPLDAGLASFFGSHAESSARLAELLVRAKKPDEAMRALRASRVRAIAAADRIERVANLGADERARWDDAVARYHNERDALDTASAEEWGLAAVKLPRAIEARRAHEERARGALDEAFAVLGERAITAPAAPVAPRDGELVLLYQAFGGSAGAREAKRGGARVFAEDARGLVTSSITLPPAGAPPDALADALLAPVAPAIERARRIRILATGRLLRVDFHALPFRGEPLVEHAPIVYAMDLPPRRPESGAATPLPAALVVADARNDLPAALPEAARVEATLRKAFTVEVLAGDGAQKAAVLRALAGAELFHFSGHAAFAGPTGWESALALADTGTLGLGDILTLPYAPRYVVLSACEAGRSPDGARVVDMSVAHAFASAGAEAVVAAVRPVKDAPAAALSTALYAGVSSRGWDLAAALRDAQRALREAMPDADWAAYRVVTR